MYLLFGIASYIVMLLTALFVYKKTEQKLVRLSALFLCIANGIMLLCYAILQFTGGDNYLLFDMFYITRKVNALLFVASIVVFRFYVFRRVLVDNEVNNGAPSFLTTLGYYLISVPITCIILNGSRQDKVKLKIFLFSILSIIGFAVVYYSTVISYSSVYAIKYFAMALIAASWFALKGQQDTNQNVKDEWYMTTLYAIIAVCITFNPYFY